MGILSHLSNWPTSPFDYEELLSLYRNRLPGDKSQLLQQRLAADQRWQGHWNSIRYLECERDYARESAAELDKFQVAQASEICRQSAASSGEALWPFVTATGGELASPLGSLGDVQNHLDACVYCRLLADDLRSELVRQQNGLPPGEVTLRDWLLDHYVREKLESLTAKLLPSRVECLAEVDRLQRSLRASPSARQHLLHINPVVLPDRAAGQAVQVDAHYFIAGGANDFADAEHNCSPAWYTRLFAAPTQLKWSAPRGEHQFQLQMRTIPGEVFMERTLPQPHYRLTAEDRATILSDRTIKWSVTDSGKPVFSAVFAILSEVEREQVRNQCDDTLLPTLVNRLSLATLLWDHQLFDPAIELLRDLQRRFGHGASGFVVNRMLAGVWRSVREELDDRRLDLPQGVWANEHVTRALEAAYLSLPN